MSVERLRNVKTGEVRDIETNSDEYQDLINEVYDHGGSARPKWEVTGQHHVRRLDEGEVDETDHGYENKPVPGAIVDVSEVGPEAHPERALTQGEVDSGVESYEHKMDNLGLTPSTAGRVPDGNTREAEPLEDVSPEDRLERGQDLAGSESGRSRRSSRSSGSSGSSRRGSGSSSGSARSGSSSSGSSGSSESGSSSPGSPSSGSSSGGSSS